MSMGESSVRKRVIGRGPVGEERSEEETRWWRRASGGRSGGHGRLLVLDPRLKCLHSWGRAGGGPTHTLTYLAAGNYVQEGLGNLVWIELDAYYVVENLNDIPAAYPRLRGRVEHWISVG